jgi:hypothetical protein
MNTGIPTGHSVRSSKPSTGRVLVRDSKDPDSPVLALTPAEWRRFTDHIKD